METKNFELQYEICGDKTEGIPVIIVAAGMSTRMQGTNKQTMCIGGIPVIARTLIAFERCEDISRIILVVRDREILEMQNICDRYAIGKLSDIVAGGATRHESVMCGMARIGADSAVLIHDGARPFVQSDIISRTVQALGEFDAALCAVRVNDTVKLADSDGTVNKTIDRSLLYLAQTPQAVNVKAYIEACKLCADPDLLTDDAAIMEAAGKTVKIVEGSRLNIKITTPQDIALADIIAKGDYLL